ncbi:hypothetical protein NDU88_001978 [Pleurodeles waltl]|uniref:Uncharacterized protein n=1 Tax=Pleurodeles waltl TaxID=8319 RepID=A0AAV7T112_PLEWA|nr:hypothetical protein NDU88_001978 [Pleurodeles waltl]
MAGRPTPLPSAAALCPGGRVLSSLASRSHWLLLSVTEAPALLAPPASRPRQPAPLRLNHVPPQCCDRRPPEPGRLWIHVGPARRPHQPGAAGPQAPDSRQISRAAHRALLARIRHIQRLGHAHALPRLAEPGVNSSTNCGSWAAQYGVET